MKARALSHNSKKRQVLKSHYQWNHRPCWDYIGKDRVVMGSPVDARTFSIRTNSSRGIIWTLDMQCWAVEQGFFVQRELVRERPVIIGISKYDPTFSYWEPYKAYQEIERRAFRRDSRYPILLDFIEQQDRYGYTGAWDIRVQNYTPDLLWYKMLKRPMHDMELRAQKLRANAEAARDAKLIKRARRLIREGHSVVS